MYKGLRSAARKQHKEGGKSWSLPSDVNLALRRKAASYITGNTKYRRWVYLGTEARGTARFGSAPAEEAAASGDKAQ